MSELLSGRNFSFLMFLMFLMQVSNIFILSSCLRHGLTRLKCVFHSNFSLTNSGISKNAKEKCFDFFFQIKCICGCTGNFL